MHALVKVGVALAALTGITLAFSKNNRFLGDRAEVKDQVTVPLIMDRNALAFPKGTPLSAAATAALVLAQETGASGVTITVEAADDDTLTGPVTGLSSATAEKTVPAGISGPIGRVTVRRADVAKVTRNGNDVA